MIYTGWRLFIGGVGRTRTSTNGRPDDAYDFTSRIVACNTEWTLGFGEVGTATLTATLQNRDGFLSPSQSYNSDIYNDNHAYDGWSFWGLPVFLVGYADTVDGTTQVQDITITGVGDSAIQGNEFAGIFTGVVSDVRIEDDGFTSTMQLTALDMGQVFGRRAVTATSSYTAGYPSWQIVEDMIDKTPLPLFGADNKTTIVSLIVGDQYDPAPAFNAGDIGADVLQNMVIAEYGVHQPWTLYFESNAYGTGSDLWIKHHTIKRDNLILPDQVKGDNEPLTIDFSSLPLSPKQLPYRDIDYGFEVDKLVTVAAVESDQDPGNYVTPDPDVHILPIGKTSVQTYGPRGARLANTPMTTTARDDLAPALLSWFDSVTFSCKAIEVTGGQIRQHANDAALTAVELLMSPPYFGNGALFRVTNIDGAGAGGATLDFTTLFMRAELSILENDWVMRLSDGMSHTYGTFIADDVSFGVLDENRI